MPDHISGIKAIIFDVDGTLYKSDPVLSRALRDVNIAKVAERLGLSLDEAEKRYDLKNAELRSTTKTLVAFGVGDVFQVTKIIEDAVWSVKKEVIKSDERLVGMMQALKQYRLYTLRNGSLDATESTLRLLGFENEQPSSFAAELEKAPAFGPFEELIPTMEQGRLKPDSKIFTGFLERTGYAPGECLMVGDRIETDLTPAKKLGIRTAYVGWQEKTGEQHSAVDYYLPTVYDVEKLLT